MGVFPKREPDLLTMSSLSAFVHTPHISRRLSVNPCYELFEFIVGKTFAIFASK
jgi:hypothetical protein